MLFLSIYSCQSECGPNPRASGKIGLKSQCLATKKICETAKFVWLIKQDSGRKTLYGKTSVKIHYFIFKFKYIVTIPVCNCSSICSIRENCLVSPRFAFWRGRLGVYHPRPKNEVLKTKISGLQKLHSFVNAQAHRFPNILR